MFKMGIFDAVAQERRKRKMKVSDLQQEMGLSENVVRRRLAEPETLRLEDFFRLSKTFGWSDAEMSDLMVATYHDLRKRKKI